MRSAFMMVVMLLLLGLGLSTQAVSDIIPVPVYPGDLNSDGMVLLDDFRELSDHWLQVTADPNFDIGPSGGDGIVSLQDLSVFCDNWLENSALPAAQSGMRCALDIIAGVSVTDDNVNSIPDEADRIWDKLCQHLQTIQPGGQAVPDPTVFSDGQGSGDQIMTSSVSCGVGDVSFILRFYRYDSDHGTIFVDSMGMNAGINRVVTAETKITRRGSFAVETAGRLHLEGDTTIRGDIFSLWDEEKISPFHAAAETCVEGTYNTVLSKEQIADQLYQLETWDEFGNPIFDEWGDRIVSEYDEIQGQHEGINYSGLAGYPISWPGLNINDYDTQIYLNMVGVSNGGNGDIPSSGTKEVEYFPHATDDYSSPSTSGCRRFYRHVYENMTFSNVRLPPSRNALFRQCTFEGILYIDCSKSAQGHYNNVRYENCKFNGIIATNTPSELKWLDNSLYFTGRSVFQNKSSIQDAIILAPHFNIELGDTNIEHNEVSEITATGAIVGGIVDVRGNAQITGMIVSMCDTTQWSNGFVTNIGDVASGNVGTIQISPPTNSSTRMIFPVCIYKKQ